MSNPDYLLALETQQTLFPDTAYAHRPGGDPQAIPDLTYDQFLTFYQLCYHPSNARFFFFGDDPPDKRLQHINHVLKPFSQATPPQNIALQPPFDQPYKISRRYPAAEESQSKPYAGVSWLLQEHFDPEDALLHSILAHSLMGTPASPLRKALSDSGLGDEVYGSGYGGGLELFDLINQMFFTAGLKGVRADALDDVESLVLGSLEEIVTKHIDPKMVQASLNTVEFLLREANYGGLPRGIMYLFGVLSTWNYDRDPLAPLAFEKPLNSIKSKIASGEPILEGFIQRHLLDNTHRVFLQLMPDPKFLPEREKREKERLDAYASSLDQEKKAALVQATQDLNIFQETPDRPEDLAKLPVLQLSDLDKEAPRIPLELIDIAGMDFYFHDLPTYGIAYLDLGFNLHVLSDEELPYIPLLGRALIELGTQQEDTVQITQRIGTETGGISSETFASSTRGSDNSQAYLFLRGKSNVKKMGSLMAILKDLLTLPNLDQKDRFLQLALEEKSRKEAGLIPGGHRVINQRLRSGFDEAGWLEEKLGGVEYLQFLRRLIGLIETDWAGIRNTLVSILEKITNQQTMIGNLTLDKNNFVENQQVLQDLIQSLPTFKPTYSPWDFQLSSDDEGLAITAQVNYVGKGVRLYDLGYQLDGSLHTILGNLQFSYLWEQIRVKGGAYGGYAFCDPISGGFTFLSYRDPNLLESVETYDISGAYLAKLQLNERELTNAIISTIGRTEPYRLPDAQGFTSMARHLTGVTDEYRQTIRDQILSTTLKDFNDFGAVLDEVAKQGRVVIMGSKERLEQANEAQGGNWLKITQVL
jgi:Zn-dependent M16 (insulinase) family peptidase